MPLRTNLSGKDFNAWDPHFFQLRFTAAARELAHIDSRCGNALSEPTALVISRAETFSCAFIEAGPEIILVHRSFGRAAYMPNEARAHRHIIFIAAARWQIYAGRLGNRAGRNRWSSISFI